MSLNRRAFLKLGLGACLLPLAGSGRAQTLVSEQLYAFGTLVQVGVATDRPALARSAIAAVARDFMAQNRQWHAWKPGALSALNQALAAGRTHSADPVLLPLLYEAQALSRASGGLFNPAIGRLVGCWGFHADIPPTGAPPGERELAALMAAPPSMDDLVIVGDRIHSRHPQLQIDFGGYAKGVALNLALDRLAAAGCGNALVNLGGNLAVSGLRDGRAWRIGVRHPLQRGAVLAAIEVSGRMAVVTSGTYERYREHAGQRYAHILDPRSGRPAAHVASATVVHPDAALADAAATALVVAGPQAWPEVARAMKLDAVLLVEPSGRVQLTPALAERLRFMVPPAGVRMVTL
ncbi:MAG: FAD:protein FMN transferase [Burkholderiales bacterium]|nr:FAD:protein FMN transferase [Burkholderiales bacterium]